MPDSEV